MKKPKEQFKLEADAEDRRHSKWASRLSDDDIKKLAENTARYMERRDAKAARKK